MKIWLENHMVIILFNGYIADLEKLYIEFTNHINIESHHFLETF